MFRVVLTCKGSPIYKSVPSNQGHFQFYSSAVNSLQLLDDGSKNARKGIDFNHLFQSCTNIHLVKRLHALLVVSGKTQSIFLSAKLVNLYSYIGDVSLSRHTFNHISTKDVYTWNSMVSAYVRSNQLREAVDCFHQFVLTSGLHPDFYTFPPVLKACQKLADGKKMHCWVLKLGLEWDIYVAASLIHMYSRFGHIKAAYELFSDMPVRDIGSWNAMISGFCQIGDAAGAMDVLNDFTKEGLHMDPVTVSSLLPICAQSGDMITGKLIHLYVIKHALDTDVFVSNALINMYSKFSVLGAAQSIFDGMEVRDLVSWNSIIAAYEQNNDPIAALKFFNEMKLIGMQPDLLTLRRRVIYTE